MVDANLQREHILPSEKAFAYKMKLEAVRNQGKRTDLTLSQVATKFDSAAQVGEAANDSRDQVFRFIRLTNLIPEILAKVDDGKIAFNPAVELSYLSEEQQRDLLAAMEKNQCTPSHAQAIQLKRAAQAGTLDRDAIQALMQQEKPNQQEQIQEWLGHSDISTTSNIYAHLDYSSKVLSASTMEGALKLPELNVTKSWD